MDTNDAAMLQSRLRLLAVDVFEAQLVSGGVPDVADVIGLATDLLVADRDTPATLEVASLSAGGSFAELRELICRMLAEHGIELDALSNADAYEGRLDAFASGLLHAADIEGSFHHQLVEWDSQGPPRQGAREPLRRARSRNGAITACGHRRAYA